MLIDKVLRRALTASPDEWRVRAAQLMFHVRNWLLSRRGSGVLPDAGHLRSLGLQNDDLSQWWGGRENQWFLDSGKQNEIRSHFSHNETERDQIIHRADLVMSGKMPLFSHPPIDFTDHERWQRDPILGVRAPDKFYGRIPYLDSRIVGDSKFVWEPNRFGWVYWLGAASVITGDERYGEKFCVLARDWFARNPYPRGINYSSSLEIAIRCYAWVWALDLFAAHLSREPDLLDELLHGIWTGCRHVERTLSYYFAPNTHLLGEAFCLFACGVALPEFREALGWRQAGSTILGREARRQLHDDGTHRELSSGYHLYTSDIYLQAYAIAQRCSVPLDATIPNAAQRLAARLEELSPPGLVLPQFNDCDGGRLTSFGLLALDAAPALATAAHLFGARELNPELRNAHGYNLWMCPQIIQTAPVGERREDAMSAKSVHDSGIVTHRNPAGDFLVFRAGPFGYMSCGHSHDAPTSIILYLAGRAVIVDSGTGSYTQSQAVRDRFRGAAGKNILSIDGRGPSEPGGWFDWKRRTDAALIQEQRISGGFLCKGTHAGYGKALGFPVTVSRTVMLFDDGFVVLLDQWTAKRPVSGQLVLTLAPDLQVDPAQRSIHGLDGQVYHFFSQQLGVGGDRLAVRTCRVPYSPNYGTLTETAALVCDFGCSRDGAWATVLSRSGPVPGTLVQSRLALAGALSAAAPPQAFGERTVAEKGSERA